MYTSKYICFSFKDVLSCRSIRLHSAAKKYTKGVNWGEKKLNVVHDIFTVCFSSFFFSLFSFFKLYEFFIRKQPDSQDKVGLEKLLYP